MLHNFIHVQLTSLVSSDLRRCPSRSVKLELCFSDHQIMVTYAVRTSTRSSILLTSCADHLKLALIATCSIWLRYWRFGEDRMWENTVYTMAKLFSALKETKCSPLSLLSPAIPNLTSAHSSATCCSPTTSHLLVSVLFSLQLIRSMDSLYSFLVDPVDNGLHEEASTSLYCTHCSLYSTKFQFP